MESLLAVAKQLQSASGVLSEKLQTTMNVPDHHSLDTFLQTVKAASDVRPNTLCKPHTSGSLQYVQCIARAWRKNFASFLCSNLQSVCLYTPLACSSTEADVLLCHAH